MNRALAIVTVLSLFVAGVAIGALGMSLHSGRHVDRHDRPHGPGNDSFFHRLHRQLDLSEEQEAKIEAILARIHDEAYELRRDLHPRVMALMDRAHQEIEEILDPEQREAFHRLIVRSRRRAEHFFLGPPGRHGRPLHGADRHPRHPRPDRPDREPGESPPEPPEPGEPTTERPEE